MTAGPVVDDGDDVDVDGRGVGDFDALTDADGDALLLGDVDVEALAEALADELVDVLGDGFRPEGCVQPPYGATAEIQRDFKSNCLQMPCRFANSLI